MSGDAAEHERSLVVWAKTFLSSCSYDYGVVDSLEDFASGNGLTPIVRAVLGREDGNGDTEDGVERTGSTTSGGWTVIMGLMQSAGLLEETTIPSEAELGTNEEGKKMAVTCLEILLRHTVTEDCLGRETFIRQIMSLDASAQCTLRRIIVGPSAGGSDAASPSRESVLDESFTASPGESSTASPPHRSSGGVGSVGTTPNDSNISSWFSPRSGDERSVSRIIGAAADAMTPLRQNRGGMNLELESEGLASEMRKCRDGVDAAKPVAPTDETIVQATADTRAKIACLALQLDEAETARTSIAAALEAQKSASAARESALREEMLKARRQAEKMLSSGEDEVIAVERALRSQHEQEVSKLQDRARRAEERAGELEPLEEEVMQLRDEVDVLRPAEGKLSKAEENLSRCRSRIEELSELPMQLKREEDAHAEVLDRCLALEGETAQIPGLRRQLDSYRRAKTDMEVANKEQSRELTIAQQEVSRLSQEVQVLSEGSGAVRSEHRRLQEALNRRAIEDAEREKGGGGIGQGISELNPVLTEELARLRRENQQLKEKVDYNTVETIQDLEQRADDADRLADSFHDQLAAERERAATTEASLVCARTRISERETEIEALTKDHASEIDRLKEDARKAADAAAQALELAQLEARETLSAAERKAVAALEEEVSVGAQRLVLSEGNYEKVLEGLRDDMRMAMEGADALAVDVEQERAREKAELEDRIESAAQAAVRERERTDLEMATAVDEWIREKQIVQEEMQREREVWNVEKERAEAELVETKRVAEAEMAEAKKSATGELEEAMRAAAALLAEAQEETAKERKGRSGEARLKDVALAEVESLEEELALGKKTALDAIEGLKRRTQELKDEAAWSSEQTQKEHESSMAQLTAEFEEYRAAHTVDDKTYHTDMDQWEHQITTQKALVANLNDQVDALKKDKRRLEREKTYYWGQAEELRISSTAGGVGADPSRDADHAQLLEQSKELIEENRELKQRLQEIDLGGSVGSARRGVGAAGMRSGSGVAAMRAEHESEMTALKEEKQDLIMKYQATASRMREQEQRCAELSEGSRELQLQVTKLQLVCKRQEKKMAASTRLSSTTTPITTEKENNVPYDTKSAVISKPRRTDRSSRSSSRVTRSRKQLPAAQQKQNVFATEENDGVFVRERGDRSQSPSPPVEPVLSPVVSDRHSGAISRHDKIRILRDKVQRGEVEGGQGVKTRGGSKLEDSMGGVGVGTGEEGTPAECVQS